MICLETQYLNINRILLLLLGLWPYQRSLLTKVQLILFVGIVTTFTICQFTTLITSECTLDFIFKVLSSAFFCSCLLIKYNSFWINADVLRSSLKQLQDVYNEINDENEIAIIQKYGNKAKTITILLLTLGMFCVLIFILLQMWPYIHDIVLTNKSLSVYHSVYFEIELFIDKEKYFYIFMLLYYSASCVGALAIIGTGTMLITYFQHTCAMFSIASYRIEQAISILQKNNLKNERKSCEEIIRAVNIHCKAMALCHFLMSNFVGSYFLLIMAGMISLSSNLLRIVSLNNNMEQLVISIILVIILYVYLFVSNHVGQEIMDHNDYVFVTVYNVNWYMAPLHIQRMILFLLQRGTKSFNLNLGGIFVPSMKSAASLTSTSISYFTVLYSTRQN
ncbi:Odorant receptor 290 [Nylanderia fulva]|uniref:Odorant receptor n=1 Tax=Nylanderia fulva TaxID=613905 RepID=A0A6G1LPT3_9HYME|nr:uncharacterized protein LOC114944098 [Nylanderia fulva]KAF3054244.1 Odorant receptor 290 [Nylanderia fulva]